LTRIRRHKIRAFAVAAVVIVAGVAAAIASAAPKVTLKIGTDIEATFAGSFSPTALPKHGSAPITLNLSGAMKTTDGTHIPPLETISLEFDKAGSLNTKGLASCTVGKLESTTTKTAEKSCKSAIVGKGNVTAEIALPEQPPFGASGPLVVFNGSKGSKQELILHVYAHVPAATTFVVPVKISKAHGKFGTKAFIQVPRIVSGSGSVTSFKAKLNKTWTEKGKKESLLNAGCPTGSLAAKGEFTFKGLPKATGELSFACKPKG
jgi:hypothetical protein